MSWARSQPTWDGPEGGAGFPSPPMSPVPVPWHPLSATGTPLWGPAGSREGKKPAPSERPWQTGAGPGTGPQQEEQQLFPAAAAGCPHHPLLVPPWLP